MKTIEMDLPLLPKWLDKKIKDATSRVNDIYKVDYVTLIFDELREVIDHRTEDIDLADKRQKYVMKNENKILTALMYGCEVED